MKAIVSRVDEARVIVDGVVVGKVGVGLLVFVGVMHGDDASAVDWMAEKLRTIRVFNDAKGKMNLSVGQVGGGLLLVPNFTLAGQTAKGTRPSYSDAANPDDAEPLFELLTERCRLHTPTETGIFGAHMLVDAKGNGPVNVIIDSDR